MDDTRASGRRHFLAYLSTEYPEAELIMHLDDRYEIISQKQVLESYNRYCNKQKQEIENLYTQKRLLEDAVAMIKFKSTNKEHPKFRHADGRYRL